MIQGVRILSQDQPFDERDVWSLLADELSLLPGMTDAGRLGFAIQLKFRQTYGHYPESISELPSGMVRVIAEQIGCASIPFENYPIQGRQAQRHRQNIRRYLGVRLPNKNEDVDHSPVFLNIAKDMGLAPYVCFASDIERYDLIDACIIATPKTNFADSLAYITHSFLRTLSSTLYKHGYALTATLLRRFLVEDNIQQSKSKYYSYAASDMKKAIDYGEGLEDSVQLPGAQAYLNVLYEQHKRKTALWPLMTDKIKGLSVGKDGVHYNGGVS